MTDSSKKDNNDGKTSKVIMVVSDSEISDEELQKIAGGAPKRYSKTIDVSVGRTDVDDAF